MVGIIFWNVFCLATCKNLTVRFPCFYVSHQCKGWAKDGFGAETAAGFFGRHCFSYSLLTWYRDIQEMGLRLER